MKNLPPWGNGRIDPFNPVKYRVLNQPVDGTIGNSDMVPLWNLKAHQGYSFHWDGLNNKLQEVVITSAIGDGTPPNWVDKDWKKSRCPIQSEANPELHQQRAAAEVSVSDRRGAGSQGQSDLRPTVRDVPCARRGSNRACGTGRQSDARNRSSPDRHVDSECSHGVQQLRFRSQLEVRLFREAERLCQRAARRRVAARTLSCTTDRFRRLPTCSKTPAQRPKVFYRGYDVLDPQKVGFVSEGRRSPTSRLPVRYRWNLETAMAAISGAPRLVPRTRRP